MIVNKYNKGGGSGNAGELEPVTEFPVGAKEGTVVALVSSGEVIPYGITFEEKEFTDEDLSGRRLTIPFGSLDVLSEEDLLYIGKVGPVDGNQFDINLSNPGPYEFLYEDPYDPLMSIILDEEGTGTSLSNGVVFDYNISGSNYVIDIYPNTSVTDNIVFSDVPTGITGVGVYQYDGENWIPVGNGGGGSNVVELTKAQYEALDPPAQDTLYVITDADAVDMNEFAPASGLTELSGTVQTLSTTVSGKADKQNVTANTNTTYFPAWNNQGVITGNGTRAYTGNLNINGTGHNVYKTSSSGMGAFYAPTSAGTAGQPLLSNGSGAPVWGGYKFAFITQTQYDALTTKDATTIYFITGD